MKVLAFDPGKTIGLAWLDMSAPRPVVLFAGSTDSLERAREWMIAVGADVAGTVVAVEQNPYYANDRGTNPAYFIDAAWLGGELAGYARGRGFRVVEASALRWRRAVVGKGTASDAQIKAVLQLLMELPKTNEHARDAIGLGLYAGRLVAAGGRAVVAASSIPAPWRPARRRAGSRGRVARTSVKAAPKRAGGA